MYAARCRGSSFLAAATKSSIVFHRFGNMRGSNSITNPPSQDLRPDLAKRRCHILPNGQTRNEPAIVLRTCPDNTQ